MAKAHGLTERTVKALPTPPAGYTLHWDEGANKIPGFACRVTSAGAKSFVMDYRTAGRKRRITIGRWPAWSVQAARERASEYLRAAQSGDDPLEQRQAARDANTNTLGRYIATDYAAHQARKKSGDQTLALLSRSFEKLHNRPLPSLTMKDIEQWRTRREADGLKFQTIKRHFDTLQGLLNHAVTMKAISANPLKGMKLQEPASTEDEQLETVTGRKILTDDEIAQFFAGLEAFNEKKREQRRNSRAHGKDHLPDLDGATYTHHAVPWLRLAYFTGFRPGDLFGLQWPHIDLDKRQIRKVIEKTAQHVKEPQTFPLSPAAVATLQAWHKDQGKPAAGYVFPSERTGGRMDKKAMQGPWRQIRKLGGLPDFLDIYSLRHNFASQMIRAGADLFTVSKLMAHTDIQTTIKNYAKLAPDQAADAVLHIPGAES